MHCLHAQVSCYEIYNERVRDLAPQQQQQQQSSVHTSSTLPNATSTATSSASLRVRESPVLGAFVEGLTRQPVQDMQQMAAVISSAIESRLVVLVAANSSASVHVVRLVHSVYACSLSVS
jgi:Kinesin motor domain